MTQFILIGLFKSINMFEEFCLLNNHIFKDEMLHSAHKCAMARKTLNGNDDTKFAKQDIIYATNLEIEFLRYLLFGKNNDLVIPKEYNIDFEMLCDAARMRADDISVGCGMEKIYNINRDFPEWTKAIGGTVKINFFEVKLNASYKSTTADAGDKAPQTLDMDEDF